MKKARNGFMNTLPYLCLVGVIALGLMTIIGTGGGGGGGGTPTGISYTGLTTEAMIDETNAEDLAVGAFEGGHTGVVIGGIDAIQTGESVHVGRPRMLKVSRILEDSLRQVDFTSLSDGTFIGAIHTESGTIDGDCGGSASYTISIDDKNGDFNGSLNFYDYCDGGVTITGGVSFSGLVDVNTRDLLRFTFSFNNLTGTSGNDSFTLNGNISCDITVSPETMTMTMLLKDNSTGKVYWVQNYTMTITEWPNYVDVELSGIYYDPDYGYVTISTPTPFRVYDDDDYPSEGVLIVTGKTGSQGGPTRARLRVIDNTEYQVDADTNGDGTYDWGPEVFDW